MKPADENAHAYSRPMVVRRLWIIGAVLAVLTPTTGLAGWSLGIDASLLPTVHALDVVDGQLNVFVGPVRREKDWSRTAYLAVRDDKGGWTFQSEATIPAKSHPLGAKGCMSPPADEAWLQANKERLHQNPDFDQDIGTCANRPGWRWGGISFYIGEGSWGVGGIVEQNTKTGTTRYYRPRALADYSTSHLEYYADRLWIGTAQYGEGGSYDGIGVLSAEFANDQLYAGRVMETCGFIVSDMLVHDDSLWIATEMGLSKVSKSGDRYKPFNWTNYVPTGDEEDPMREVTCDEVYEELFQSTDLASALPNDSGHPYGVLWHRVSKLRPNFAWRYVRKLNGLERPADSEHPE